MCVRERDTEGGKGGEEGKVFFCIGGEERMLYQEVIEMMKKRACRESETRFCLLSHGHCQMSVSVACCFVSSVIWHLSGLCDKP